MKRFFSLLSVLALVVSMQGCGSAPSVEPEIPDTPNNPTQSAVQLRLKGNIASLAPSTRVNADGFEADDKVGVYVSATGTLASSGNMLDNTAFTYAGGNLTAPEGKEIYWGSPDVRLSVWAYYPYATNIANLAEYPFAVEADQSTATNFYNSDFITAKATNLAPQAEAVNLIFNHSLSKINITLKAGDGITADELAAAEKNFYISGLATSGTINLTTGTATTSEAKTTITPFASDGVNYSAIVYPQEGEVTFRMEMAGDTYTYTTDVDFAAGYQYQFNLTINTWEAPEMTISNATINTWEDGEENNGEMEKYKDTSNIITNLDANLKSYLINSKKIDINNDGEISELEASKIYSLDLSSVSIEHLGGLAKFSNLESISIYNLPSNVLELSIDNSSLKHISITSCSNLYFLSINTCSNLESLSCELVSITSLNVSNNPNLESLYLSNTSITDLDVSKNTALTELWCVGGQNQLTALDVSKNTALEVLDCSCNHLTTLDVSKNTALTHLNCGSNRLNTLDTKNNTALKSLYCYDNMHLNSLDVSNNRAITILECWGNKLNSLDVSNNTVLTRLDCEYNQLETLDVTNNTALTYLNCVDNQLTSLDVSKNTELTTLKCSPMNDAQGNNLLAKLYLASGQEIETLKKPEATEIEYK